MDQDTKISHGEESGISSSMSCDQQEEVQVSKKAQNDAFDEMTLLPVNDYYEIRIKDPLRGRGLFAKRNIPKFTLIHTAPCIHIPHDEYEQHLKYTELEHYVFNCTKSGGKMVALGHGSLFNHDSKSPNINFEVDADLCLIRYRTSFKEVKVGEELCISYGSKVWWDDSESESEDEDLPFLERINL